MNTKDPLKINRNRKSVEKQIPKRRSKGKNNAPKELTTPKHRSTRKDSIKEITNKEIAKKITRRSTRSNPSAKPVQAEMTQNKHQCTDCSISFKTIKLLKQHTQIVHRIEIFHECSHCKEKFDNIDSLYTHLRTHQDMETGEGVYQCLVCKKVLNSSNKLLFHMSANHKGIKPYRCEYCAKTFSQIDTLEVHQQTMHLCYSAPYLCTLCKMQFESVPNLTKHMTEEHKKPFKCSNCVKCFDNMTVMRKHQRTHTMERSHQCDQCAKSFSLATGLKLHKAKVHEIEPREKPFRCPLCDYPFVQLSDLNTHIYSHSDESPFECPDCADLYEDLKLFYDHIKVHDASKTITIIRELDQYVKEESFQSENVIKEEIILSDHNPHSYSDDEDYFNELPSKPSFNKESTSNIETDLAKLGVTITFTCPICKEQYNEISEFNKHTATHTHETNSKENLPLRKDQLKKTARKQRQPRAPVSLAWQEKDNKIRNFSCKLCNRSYTLASTLSLHHRRTHLGIKPYECKVCAWSFAQSSDLIKHMRKHTGEKPFTCPSCNAGFTQNRNLKNHMKLHSEEPSKCPYCSKEFGLETSLKQHLKKHESDDAAKCTICAIPYTTKKLMDHHMKRVHRAHRPYKCDLCSKTFSKKNDIKKHSIIHTNLRPYVCEVCKKDFTHLTSLRNHQVVHTGDKPFQCSYCGQAFSLQGNLKVHIRSHTGERPYECQVCFKRFARNPTLNEHVKIHTGERTFCCEICNKSFTNSSTLSKHRKIHTGIRPHRCAICDKAFIQYSHLSKHMRIHTGEKPYVCHVCDKGFRRSDTLAIHQKTHQKDGVMEKKTKFVEIKTNKNDSLPVTTNQLKIEILKTYVEQQNPCQSEKQFVAQQQLEQFQELQLQTSEVPTPVGILLTHNIAADKTPQIMYTITTPDQLATVSNISYELSTATTASLNPHFVITQL